MKTTIRGSCLCGGVRCEADPPFLRANHCHCDRCRKHSGTAVCTQTRVRREQFRDDDPGIRPQYHSFVDSRAPWDEIADDLPQYREAWLSEAARTDENARPAMQTFRSSS